MTVGQSSSIGASRLQVVIHDTEKWTRGKMTELATTIVRNLGELRRLEMEWRDLALSLSEISFFQLPEWVFAWWEYFGAGRELYCVAVHHSGDLVGFAPLMIQRRFGLRMVSFIGSPLNDRNRFVAADANALFIRKAIRQCLLEHADEWDLIDLANVDDDRLIEWRESLQSSPGSRCGCVALRPTPHPVMPVPVSWQDYWDRMPRERRRVLRRRARQLERDHQASYGVTLTPGEVAPELTKLLDLKRRSWQERGKLSRMNHIHQTPAFAGFLGDACTQLAQRHMAFVAHLRVQGIPIASSLCFVVGTTLISYQSSYDTRFSRYAPGILLNLHIMRYAIQSGLRAFDFGTGDEPYKFAFGALPAFNHNLVVAAPGLRGRVLLSQRWMANKTAILRDAHVVPLLRRFRWPAHVGQRIRRRDGTTGWSPMAKRAEV